MKISYLVTCHNEVDELHNAVWQLKHALYNIACRDSRVHEDEIVVLDDYSDNPETVKILNRLSTSETGSLWKVNVVQHHLDGDFGTHKTWGSRQCTGDYIVQLDADETLAPELLYNIHELLEANPAAELYRVPRVNIVRGVTQRDINTWGWHVSSLPEFPNCSIINWASGDYQSRIYKNAEHIKWSKKLHETVTGATVVTDLPKDPSYAIIHDKTIERQRQQNEFYNKNWSIQANMGKG